MIFQYQVTNSQSDSLKFGLKGKIIRALGKSSTSPPIFYAGLKGGELGSALIYKSEDFGKTWFPLNNNKPISPYASDIQAISIANDSANSIYAGTWKDGLFKSVDNGKTWKKVLTAPSSDIRNIKMGIQNPLLLHASTSSFGVMNSTDAGETWIPDTIEVAENFAPGDISAIDGEKAWVAVYDANGGGGIYNTIDGGQNWNHQESAAYSGTSSFCNVIQMFNIIFTFNIFLIKIS